jgi:hypothetical protein
MTSLGMSRLDPRVSHSKKAHTLTETANGSPVQIGLAGPSWMSSTRVMLDT